MNDEVPKTTNAPTFTFRQCGVLSEGFEIRKPVTVPVVKIWKSCQRVVGSVLAAGRVESVVANAWRD